MSSTAPESSSVSNVEMELKTEMGKNECVMVEIPRNDDNDNDNDNMAKEWVYCMKGYEETKRSKRERYMEKVPSSFLKGEKGDRNREYYEPAAVALGPYHHNRPDLAKAENYKLITLQEYCLRTEKPSTLLNDKVLEVVHDARKCYIDDSTDAYSDEEFSLMMLRDACFILFFIECISYKRVKIMLTHEYLGTTEFVNIMRDIFLLENQIPFVVLEVLLNLEFPDDKGEYILNGFFNFLKFGVVKKREEKVLEYKKPLHLLELYRSYFISLPNSHSLQQTDSTIQSITEDLDEEFNYVRRNRWFSSATELKAKRIYLNESTNEDHDMSFKLFGWHGEFRIACRAVSSYTKAIYMNMIAYEMCPHNPNDFRVSTYVRVMKALIIQDMDVKELRDKNVLIHGLGRDEKVVKMFAEIEVPAVTLPIFNDIRHEIGRIHMTKYKRWMRELINDYLGSPWKVVGVLVAASILVIGFLQTHFTINPRADNFKPPAYNFHSTHLT